MSVQYENLEDSIAADEDECSLDSAEGATEDQPMTGGGDLRILRIHAVMQDRWPLKSGVMHTLLGVAMVLLGLSQTVLVPLILDTSTAFDRQPFQPINNYGMAIWTGVLMVISGGLAIRSAIYRSISSVYMFFTVILLEIIALFAMVLIILINIDKWKKHGDTQEDIILFGLNIGVCVGLVLSFALVIYSFTQFYEDVCFGELQLCRRCLHGCVPCWCPRAVEREELLAEEPGPERPPSLPV